MNIRLPGSSSETSWLGFGCAALSGGESHRAGRRLIECAIDAGIRHFDVAPNYGLGMAEDVLGQALGGCCTVATKVGMGRPIGGLAFSALRHWFRPMVRKSRALKRLSAKAGAKLSSSNTIKLTANTVRSSAKESLSRLRRSQVELLLLHEVLHEDVSAEILDALEKLKAEGAIGAYGIGVAAAQSEFADPTFGDVLQCAFDLYSVTRPSEKFVITHRAVMRNYDQLLELIRAHPNGAERLSRDLNFDLKETERLGDLLLAAALSANSGGIVLFSSHNLDRIRRYAQIPTNSGLLLAGQRLNNVAPDLTNYMKISS